MAMDQGICVLAISVPTIASGFVSVAAGHGKRACPRLAHRTGAFGRR